MTKFSAEEFINNFLQHKMSPAEVKAYNREYYLRKRKLKGQPKRVEEDEVPMTSPSGAKLVDYDGSGSGKATYSDGSSFDGNGWSKGTSSAAREAALKNRLDKAKKKASSLGGDRGNEMRGRLAAAEKKLKNAQENAGRPKAGIEKKEEYKALANYFDATAKRMEARARASKAKAKPKR